MKCAKVQEKNVTRRARYLFRERERKKNCWNLKKGTCIYFHRKKKLFKPKGTFGISYLTLTHRTRTWNLDFACFFVQTKKRSILWSDISNIVLGYNQTFRTIFNHTVGYPECLNQCNRNVGSLNNTMLSKYRP